jgi:hypothetical protein
MQKEREDTFHLEGEGRDGGEIVTSYTVLKTETKTKTTTAKTQGR